MGSLPYLRGPLGKHPSKGKTAYSPRLLPIPGPNISAFKIFISCRGKHLLNCFRTHTNHIFLHAPFAGLVPGPQAGGHRGNWRTPWRGLPASLRRPLPLSAGLRGEQLPPPTTEQGWPRPPTSASWPVDAAGGVSSKLTCDLHQVQLGFGPVGLQNPPEPEWRRE